MVLVYTILQNWVIFEVNVTIYSSTRDPSWVMVHSLVYRKKINRVHVGSSHSMHLTIPVWGSPKKGKCPVKSVSEHMVLYHTVFRKIDGFSMSIINVVLKCYQSLNYILDIIWVCGLWYQTKPTGSQKSWVSHINLPVKSCFFFKTIDPPGITPRSTPRGEIYGGSCSNHPSGHINLVQKHQGYHEPSLW